MLVLVACYYSGKNSTLLQLRGEPNIFPYSERLWQIVPHDPLHLAKEEQRDYMC